MSALVRGTLLALLSALAFGASAPLVRRFGVDAGPWATAALLYAGAALLGLLSSRSAAREAAPRRAELTRIAVAALLGAALGPALFAWGLQRTSALGASLALTVESAATVVLAAAFLREHIGRRVWLAVSLTSVGAALVAFRGGAHLDPSSIGTLAVVAATILWAVDSTITGSLAWLDPGRVTFWKCAGGALLSLAAALLARDAFPSWQHAVLLALTGAIAYGASLRLYLGAQRAFGAARTASIFALAPFAGAAVALALGERDVGLPLIAGAALMIIAVVLHATERHAHLHEHTASTHEHAHSHDDVHHTHAHEPAVEGAHSHLHAHDPLVHEHAHGPDFHHAHPHA
jgi:drug/metabolite transporter (DMT)-like permease